MTNNNIKKPVLLCILDGFGIEDSPEKKQQKKQQKTSQTTNDSANAIALAKMPNYQRFLKTYPNSQLQTS
jgi:bisphosphoglycerate-independent phosphoglycerate mutase (AlkP superfamily)